MTQAKEKNKRFDINLEKYFSVAYLSQNIPFLFFLAVLAVAYISNTHFAERKQRELDKVRQDIKQYRWYYVSAKSELMFKSKQSEVLKLVEPLGLKELIEPPQKIVVKQ